MPGNQIIGALTFGVGASVVLADQQTICCLDSAGNLQLAQNIPGYRFAGIAAGNATGTSTAGAVTARVWSGWTEASAFPADSRGWNLTFASALTLAANAASLLGPVVPSGTAGTTVALGVSRPAAPTITQTAGGTLAARNEYYRITYVSANGETTGSAEVETVFTAADLIAVVASPAAFSGAVSYNVYGGATSGSETLQTSTPIAIGTNWTEPTTGLTTTGAKVPAVNTANAVVVGTLLAINADGTGLVGLAQT